MAPNDDDAVPGRKRGGAVREGEQSLHRFVGGGGIADGGVARGEEALLPIDGGEEVEQVPQLRVRARGAVRERALARQQVPHRRLAARIEAPRAKPR